LNFLKTVNHCRQIVLSGPISAIFFRRKDQIFLKKRQKKREKVKKKRKWQSNRGTKAQRTGARATCRKILFTTKLTKEHEVLTGIDYYFPRSASLRAVFVVLIALRGGLSVSYEND